MPMLVIWHVLIAFASVAFVSRAYIRPSQQRLRITYAAMTATVITGAWLVMLAPGHLAQSCVMGIAYLTVIGIAAWATRRKLARLLDTA